MDSLPLSVDAVRESTAKARRLRLGDIINMPGVGLFPTNLTTPDVTPGRQTPENVYTVAEREKVRDLICTPQRLPDLQKRRPAPHPKGTLTALQPQQSG